MTDKQCSQNPQDLLLGKSHKPEPVVSSERNMVMHTNGSQEPGSKLLYAGLCTSWELVQRIKDHKTRKGAKRNPERGANAKLPTASPHPERRRHLYLTQRGRRDEESKGEGRRETGVTTAVYVGAVACQQPHARPQMACISNGT